MACNLCHIWYHPNCTGLTEDQYVTTEAQDLRFHCAVCVHQQMMKPEMVSKQDAITDTIDDGDAEQHPHTSPLNMARTIDSFLSDFASTITEKLEEMSKKQLELSPQIFKLGSVLPFCTTAQEVHRLSSQEVVEASLSLKDQIIRERRLILWGNFQKGTDPSTTAQKVIASVCESIKGNCVVAQWFRVERSKSIRGILVSLPSCDHVVEVVSKRLLSFGEILQHPKRVAGLSEKPACKTAVFRTPDPSTKRYDFILPQSTAHTLEAVTNLRRLHLPRFSNP